MSIYTGGVSFVNFTPSARMDKKAEKVERQVNLMKTWLGSKPSCAIFIDDEAKEETPKAVSPTDESIEDSSSCDGFVVPDSLPIPVCDTSVETEALVGSSSEGGSKRKSDSTEGTCDSKKKAKRFQLNSQKLFLTYPRCPLKKEEVMVALKAIFKSLDVSVESLCVAEEEHQLDGDDQLGQGGTTGRHIHALALLSSTLRIRNARFADIAGYHGRYEGVRSVKAVAKYIQKDGVYIVEGVDPFKCGTASNGAVSARVTKLIMDGAEVADLLQNKEDLSLCSYVMKNLRTILQFQSFCRRNTEDELKTLEWSAEAELLKPKNLHTLTSAQVKMRKVMEWVISCYKVTLPFKTPQLYLKSTSDHGKTSFALKLMSFFRVFWAGTGQHLYDDFNAKFEMCVFDEFHIKNIPNIRTLNQFLDGQVMSVPCRYNNVLKAKNIPCLILSNYSPDQMFRDSTALSAFKSRILYVEIEEGEKFLFDLF